MKKITIYTDGACSGNPGPGGWGAILEYKGVRKEILEELMMNPEFEETLAAFQSALTSIIAKWDLADQLDTARNAA